MKYKTPLEKYNFLCDLCFFFVSLVTQMTLIDLLCKISYVFFFIGFLFKRDKRVDHLRLDRFRTKKKENFDANLIIPQSVSVTLEKNRLQCNQFQKNDHDLTRTCVVILVKK